MPMDTRPKVRVTFTKRNGQPGSVLEPVPANWGAMNANARQTWARNTALHVHSGATNTDYEYPA